MDYRVACGSIASTKCWLKVVFVKQYTIVNRRQICFVNTVIFKKIQRHIFKNHCQQNDVMLWWEILACSFASLLPLGN